MGLKSIFGKIKKTLTQYFFNEYWRCAVCGREIFEEKIFCSECENNLPYNDVNICDHCGRKTLSPTEYCLTCKEKLVDLDKGRSAFNYEQPIVQLIHRAKYRDGRFLCREFGKILVTIYFKNYFNADFITYIPMTKKDERKRGYNQTRLIANALSEQVNVPVIDCLEKVKQTSRQAKLTRDERLENLKGAFKVKTRKIVNGKKVLIIDDVTTTGATLSLIATKLKKAGAEKVFSLTVASVGAREGY